MSQTVLNVFYSITIDASGKSGECERISSKTTEAMLQHLDPKHLEVQARYSAKTGKVEARLSGALPGTQAEWNDRLVQTANQIVRGEKVQEGVLRIHDGQKSYEYPLIPKPL